MANEYLPRHLPAKLSNNGVTLSFYFILFYLYLSRLLPVCLNHLNESFLFWKMIKDQKWSKMSHFLLIQIVLKNMQITFNSFKWFKPFTNVLIQPVPFFFFYFANSNIKCNFNHLNQLKIWKVNNYSKMLIWIVYQIKGYK